MNLLVTGAWNSAKEHLGQLEELGHTVCFMQYENGALPCRGDWVEGVICNGLFLHHPIEEFPNLAYIQLTSAGYDRVPVEYIRKRHIQLYNARGVYSAPMAEFAFCGVLQLYKQMPFFYENQKMRVWEKRRDLRELDGKTVCVIGCGSVGTACAKRFAAFGCTVTGVDVQPYENGCFSEMLPLEALDETLPRADVLILTLPLTDKSRRLINGDRLALMKPDAVLVNISRGGTVDTGDLTKALIARPTFGAVLDVSDPEPLDPSHPLWTLPNVVLTPHNSFVGEGNNGRLAERIIDSLKANQI